MPFEALQHWARLCEKHIEDLLVEPGVPASLAQAMRYCVLGGGKRLRPALVMMSAQAIGYSKASDILCRAAVAVELVHCYSLVHDDLPAMDDDTLRRGRPTAHVQFGEAMAILAGDALLTRAMGLLAESGDALAGSLVCELAQAAGAAGMIAGQVADMDLCPAGTGMDALNYIHARKTAAMIRCATRMGGLCGGASEAQLSALSDFGLNLGLAFQLKDDLLDVLGQAHTLGKTPGKDAASGKRTHLTEMPIDAAKEMVVELTNRAVGALTPLKDNAKPLADLARMLIERTN